MGNPTRQRFIGLLFLFSLLSGCQQLWGGYLSKEKLTDILVDLEIAKTLVHYQHKGDEQATIKQLIAQNAQLVYETHNTDEETFVKSYRYYLQQIEPMLEIYEAVVARVKQQLATVQRKDAS